MRTYPAEPAKILVVDDEEAVRDILSRWLTAEGYECLTAPSADGAYRVLSDDTIPLVLTDIMMPHRSGVDLLVHVRRRWPDIAVIMVTALDDRETAIRALQLGAYGYIIKPFDRNEILINVASALGRRRLALAGRLYQQRLEEEVQRRTAEVRQRQEEIVLHLLTAAEFRDQETGAHVRRIGMYSAAIAEALGWPARTVDDIRIAAPMHDVGKIGVPDSILRKPGRLTRPELEVMRTHTAIGADILNGSDVPLLQTARDIALSHHEKWDGSGYPHGLSGTAIPLCARVVAIADVYDALVHRRVYRPALPEEQALAVVTQDCRRHFDPDVLSCFARRTAEFREIRETVKDEHEEPGPGHDSPRSRQPDPVVGC